MSSFIEISTCFHDQVSNWISNLWSIVTGEFELTAPKAKNILRFFYTKDLFFFYREKGKWVNNCHPLIFSKNCRKGRGQLIRIPLIQSENVFKMHPKFSSAKKPNDHVKENHTTSRTIIFPCRKNFLVFLASIIVQRLFVKNKVKNIFRENFFLVLSGRGVNFCSTSGNAKKMCPYKEIAITFSTYSVKDLMFNYLPRT